MTPKQPALLPPPGFVPSRCDADATSTSYGPPRANAIQRPGPGSVVGTVPESRRPLPSPHPAPTRTGIDIIDALQPKPPNPALRPTDNSKRGSRVMSQFIEFGSHDSIEVQCHDDEAIIILGPEPDGLRLLRESYDSPSVPAPTPLPGLDEIRATFARAAGPPLRDRNGDRIDPLTLELTADQARRLARLLGWRPTPGTDTEPSP